MDRGAIWKTNGHPWKPAWNPQGKLARKRGQFHTLNNEQFQRLGKTCKSVTLQQWRLVPALPEPAVKLPWSQSDQWWALLQNPPSEGWIKPAFVCWVSWWERKGFLTADSRLTRVHIYLPKLHIRFLHFVPRPSAHENLQLARLIVMSLCRSSVCSTNVPALVQAALNLASPKGMLVASMCLKGFSWWRTTTTKNNRTLIILLLILSHVAGNPARSNKYSAADSCFPGLWAELLHNLFAWHRAAPCSVILLVPWVLVTCQVKFSRSTPSKQTLFWCCRASLFHFRLSFRWCQRCLYPAQHSKVSSCEFNSRSVLTLDLRLYWDKDSQCREIS